MEKERTIFLESIISSDEKRACPATDSSGGYCAKKDLADEYYGKSIDESMNESKGKIWALKYKKSEAWNEILEEIANINPLVTAGAMGAYSLSFAGLAGFLGTSAKVYFPNSGQDINAAVVFCIASAIEGALFCASAFSEYKNSGRSKIKSRINEFRNVSSELRKESAVYKSLRKEYKQKE
jgi:hypothetical protein